MAVASITAERFPAVEAESVIELAHMFCTARSHEELRDRAMSALRPYGFMGFTFAVIRRVKSVYLHASVFSTWPSSIQTTFEQQRLFEADPVILRSRTTHEPFVWDLSIYDETQDVHRALLGLRRATGIQGGICLPVFEAFSGRSILFLSGAGFDTSPKSILALQLLTEHLANRVNALNLPEHDDAAEANRFFRSGGELSPRERQVFGWIAFGKSSRDIASIMSISEHTVNDYIASVMAKLKASNRTEAVLRALLTNQIDLI